MHKILLIGVNAKFTHSNLAIRYMRAYADVPIFECTINDDIFSVYRKLIESDADILCFSTYIWNADFIKKLCSMLATAKPNLKIILGGPEAGYDKEALFSACPWLFGCITGEGEEAIKQLTIATDFADVPNLSYRKDNQIVQNVFQQTDLSKLSFPYNEQDLKHELQDRILYFETARGCLFRCSYCLSSAEGKTRHFPMDYVKHGLKFFMDHDVPLVKLVDRTFNENDERACEIVSYILENNRCTRFHFEIAPQLLTAKFVQLCATAPHFFQFEMGIQTTNKKTMLAISRPYDMEATRKKIAMIPHTIHRHMDLIAGLPHETLESFKAGFNYVYALKPDMLQLGFLKLLKHTKMFDDAPKYGIQTTNFAPYEVILTATLSAQDIILLKKTEQAVDRFYNSGAFSQSIEALQIEDPFAFYSQLGCVLYEQEKKAPLSRRDLYTLLFQLAPHIKKSLAVDFLNHNRKAVLPDALSDENQNAKAIHKRLAALPQFAGIRFRLVFAAGCAFAVSDSSVTEVTDLI